MDDAGEVTQLLREVKAGRAGAMDDLVPLVYDELRRIAECHMRRESEGHTLQPTALVNEAYMKLVDQTRVDWQGRTLFLAVPLHDRLSHRLCQLGREVRNALEHLVLRQPVGVQTRVVERHEQGVEMAKIRQTADCQRAEFHPPVLRLFFKYERDRPICRESLGQVASGDEID